MTKFCLSQLYATVFFCLFSLSCDDSKAITDSPDPSETGGESSYNANVVVPPYNGYFLFGSNMGYKNTNWSDQAVSDMLIGSTERGWEGVGVNSLRPALYEGFVEQWGYSIRVDAFQHYADHGARNNAVFIADRPSDAHREKRQYAEGKASQSFENLYEPIWDDGKDGTPVNEKNYYAAYVYKLVSIYKDYVKFWEIKNEPDYTSTGNGDRVPGEAGNWWDADPAPGDLTNWNAPIQSYVRLLRVSYEVIKHLDPDAYVCIGGVGYESFLDAVLRNTDNPDGGKVTQDYPYQGGAWFDCLSFHIYPMFHLHSWDNGMRYHRHSDAAVQSVIDRKDKFQKRIAKYGYGTEYPLKEVICTEVNIPSVQIGNYIGSAVAQRSFLIKMAVRAQQNDFCAIYPYCVWDGLETSGSAFDHMGFFKSIADSPKGFTPVVNDSGIAWRTASRQLSARMPDAAEIARLSLPAGIAGGAFRSATGDYVYVLWAMTDKDLSESASAVYRFPESMKVKQMMTTAWNEKQTTIAGSSLTLTGEPVFVQVER